MKPSALPTSRVVPHFKLKLVMLCCLLIAMGSIGEASAKTSRRVSHSYEKIWPTAIRFLRIDEGLAIVEKDVESGYVLFELNDDGRSFSGALEVVRRKDKAGRHAVEVFLSIQDRPSYMEHGILDRMLKKIVTELGQPKRPPKVEPEPPKDEEADPSK